MCRLMLLLSIVLLFISCGSFNEAEAELHYYNTVSHGQQLLDLKEALDNSIILGAAKFSAKDLLPNSTAASKGKTAITEWIGRIWYKLRY